MPKKREDAETAGQRLAEARRLLGINQKTFGLSLGLRQANVSHLEQGNEIDTVMAIAIEGLYGINRTWLLEGVGPKFIKGRDVKYPGMEILAIEGLKKKAPEFLKAATTAAMQEVRAKRTRERRKDGKKTAV